MEYIEVHFRIKSGYNYNCRFADDQQRTAFFEESTKLFERAGWGIQSLWNSGACPTVTRGLERLYLHPIDFSGEVLPESILEIQQLLAQASNFSCYAVDRYKTFVDISDAEYMGKLESQRAVIRQDILDGCRTKRRNLYHTGSGIHDRIAAKYKINRIADRDKYGSLAGMFVSLLFDELVEQGLILLAKTRYGEGYRAATDKDLKKADYQRILLT